MPDLQPPIHLAEEMGEGLGAGQVLLGSVQKEARDEFWMNLNSTTTIMQGTSSLLRSLRQQRKGVMVMAKQQKAWMPKPAKTSKTAIPECLKAIKEDAWFTP